MVAARGTRRWAAHRLPPLAKAKSAADAYTAVLDRMDGAFTYDAKLLIELLQVEHEERQSALKHGHTMDTILFWIGG